jgi:hypothetical protein
VKSVTHVTSNAGESTLWRSICRSHASSEGAFAVLRLPPATGLRTCRLLAHIIHSPFPPSTTHPLNSRQIATPSRLPFCTRRSVSSSEAIAYVPISIELLHSVRGSQSLRSAMSRRRTDSASRSCQTCSTAVHHSPTNLHTTTSKMAAPVE